MILNIFISLSFIHFFTINAGWINKKNKIFIIMCANFNCKFHYSNTFSTKSVPNLDNSIQWSQWIETLNSCKFLGVHIDSKLSFKTHIDLIINKISRNTGIFFKIRDNLPMKARINYYYSFIYPYLIYNVLTFGSTYECHLAKLITQQKRIIRAIANSDFHDHTDPLFYRLKLVKFTDIYKYQYSASD